MRIATWNIEWFSELFDQQNQLQADDKPSHRYKVTRARQADAIARVLAKLQADILIVVEAPNTGGTQSSAKALRNFAQTYKLRQTTALQGFESHTHQEITALYDPAKATLRHAPQSSTRAPRFDTEFKLDIDVDTQPEVHTFSKPPLEVEITAPDLPRPLRLIGVHAKSKAPHKARTPQEVTAMSIANRRKQLAQCIWLRARIDDHLDRQDPLIVCGDLNDGPGLDGFEKLFGRSSIEVVLGDPDTPDRMLKEPHAQAWLNPRQGWSLASARFYHRDLKRYVNTLLDYMMLSPDLAATAAPRWRIWHPFDDPKIYRDTDLRDALLDASDHFPVSVDLTG